MIERLHSARFWVGVLLGEIVGVTIMGFAFRIFERRRKRNAGKTYE